MGYSRLSHLVYCLYVYMHNRSVGHYALATVTGFQSQWWWWWWWWCRHGTRSMRVAWTQLVCRGMAVSLRRPPAPANAREG